MTLAPGIHDIPAAEYHQDPAGISLSASMAKILISQSPAHARAAHPKLNPNYQREDEQKFDLGNVCHALLLQGIEAAEVLAFPDWRTKAAKEARELARSHGRIPMLIHQWSDVEAMVGAVQTQLAQLDVLPQPFTAGKPEQTLVWEEAGVLCRARLDWLHNDLSAADDFKSTSRSANPETWCRTTLWSIGADVQVAFHLRGIKAVLDAEPEWRFIVAETGAPFALSVVALSPAARELAEAKVDWALATWKRCLETDTWDGYPQQVCYAEPPAYLESQWLAREDVAA